MNQEPNQPTPAPQSSTRRPALYTVDLDLVDAITAQLGVPGTAAQRFHGLITWVQQQREASAPAEPTTPDVILPVVSNQAKTLAWLTDEIRNLRQQSAAQQDSEASRAWRSERSIMQAKIDSLASENQTLRRRLERFDSLRQVLMRDSEPQSHSTSPDAPQTSPDAPGMTEQSEATITAPPQRRPASAQERAARIWQVIQEWNDTHNRPPTEKVALSASTLEKRFGIYRPAAQQFMADHQQEITAHAQAHAITAPAHNRSVLEFVWEILKERATETD
jgi:hypothetical protein